MTRPGGGWAGIAVGAVRDGGPKGLIEFVNCTTENTGKESVKVYDKSADGALVRFVRCKWRNPWISPYPEYGGPRVPVLIELRRPALLHHFGGIDFEDCYVYDSAARPAVQAEEDQSEFGVRELHGRITVRNPAGIRMRLGHAPVACDLTLTPAPE